jgi:S-adenosylmethionine hydrolase
VLFRSREKVKQAIVLTRREYFLPEVSMTFHGRDIFAPVAAHLSLGVKPGVFGYQTKLLRELRIRRPIVKNGKLSGEILHIDTFGNLVSNIDGESLFQFIRGRPFVIWVGGKGIRELKRGYWEGKEGEPIALVGSGGFLEISIKEGNAQKVLKVKRGDPITIRT